MTEPVVAPGPPDDGAPVLDVPTVNRHKDTHLRMLEDQEKYGLYVLDFQINHHTKYLHKDAEQVKENFNLQLKMEVDQQELLLTHQFDKHVLALKTQAAHQKGALEQQAMRLKMAYHEQVQLEAMQKRQIEMEESHATMQRELEDNMIKQGITLPKPAAQFPPQQQQLLMEMHLQQQHQQQLHRAEQQHLLHHQQQMFALQQQQPHVYPQQPQQGPFVLSPSGGMMQEMQARMQAAPSPSGYTSSTAGE